MAEWTDYVELTPKVRKQLQDLPYPVLGVACGVSFVLGYKVGRMPKFWRRYTAVSDIPSSYFDGGGSTWLRGRAVTVSDGDTFRFLHVPTWFHSTSIQGDEKVSDTALPIRVCTIDTPETAKFGKPGQPFGEDAKHELQDLIENKTVRINLLTRDQYGRAVAEVRTGTIWPFRKYVDQRMLKAGLAEVYTGSGAVYGHKGKDSYLAMQEKAKNKKIGMWSQKNRESAAEFKARTKS